MDNVHIDMNALIQQFKDEIAIQTICSLSPDENSKKLITSTLRVFTNYGVPVETAFKILQEISYICNKGDQT